MKKLIFILITAIVTGLSFIPLRETYQQNTAYAWVGDAYVSAESAFNGIMDEMNNEHGFLFDSYTSTSKQLFSADNEPAGYVYDFTLDSAQKGYVLMIRRASDCYEVTEISIGNTSPFYDTDCVCIYPAYFTYIAACDGKYYDLKLGMEITYSQLMQCEEAGFGFSGSGTGNRTQATERVDYATKDITFNGIKSGIPTYCATNNKDNVCSVIAGSIVVGYWDHYKTNLIPNYSPAKVWGDLFMWKSAGTEIVNLVEQLYNDMKTNTTGAGTTIAQFKNGINTYARQHGNYSVSYRSTMTNGSLDLTKMASEFSNKRPVVLFMSPNYNLVGAIIESNGYDTIHKNFYSNAGHTMVAEGITDYVYKNSAGQVVRSLKMLSVAGCNPEIPEKGWVILNEGNLNIVDSIGVEII